MTTTEKLTSMGLALLLFGGLVVLLLFLASRARGRGSDRKVALVFLLPLAFLIAVGLVYPALRTMLLSLSDASGDQFVGLENYQTIFTSDDQRTVLRNTFLWVALTPFLSTAIGLVYAIVVDRSRFEAFAKALVFLPMAISFVGASLIWKFVYEFRPDQEGVNQIGLLNQVLVSIGLAPRQFLLDEPWNNLFLIAIMVWIQAGFAMTVLSAAIKAIPDDIVEAARLDGVGALGMFRHITVPSIRPALVVVVTTIAIATLKVFDIVQTVTGGQFGTSVVANEFYAQAFRADNSGLSSALAVLLFLLVVPIVVYNVRQMRAAEAAR